MWVVPAAGGQSRRVAPGLTAARAPIWSPDGKHLLFVGYASAKLHDDVNLDWRLATVDGSDGVKTGLHDALIKCRTVNSVRFSPLPILLVEGHQHGYLFQTQRRCREPMGNRPFPANRQGGRCPQAIEYWSYGCDI